MGLLGTHGWWQPGGPLVPTLLLRALGQAAPAPVLLGPWGAVIQASFQKEALRPRSRRGLGWEDALFQGGNILLLPRKTRPGGLSGSSESPLQRPHQVPERGGLSAGERQSRAWAGGGGQRLGPKACSGRRAQLKGGGSPWAG